MRTEQDLASYFAKGLRAVCRTYHLDDSNARCLQLHATAVYLLPREDIVVRLAEGTGENVTRARIAVQVTRWLTDQGFPATKPVGDELPQVQGVVATLWQHYPQPNSAERAPAAALGGLIRSLHQLPDPPFALPILDPLARLRHALQKDGMLDHPVLSMADREFLDVRSMELDAAYRSIEFELGAGLIHNDAHCGNLLIERNSSHGFVLCDWDSTHRGPREIDLLPEGLPGNRFRTGYEDRQAFCEAYGVDLARRPDWPILRDLRELHSLAAYIRMSSFKPAVRDELRIRLESLRTGNRSQRWRPVK